MEETIDKVIFDLGYSAARTQELKTTLAAEKEKTNKLINILQNHINSANTTEGERVNIQSMINAVKLI